MSARGPVEQAARDAIEARDALIADKKHEAAAFAEIDCVDAVKALLRLGSPRLRAAVVKVALGHAHTLKQAA